MKRVAQKLRRLSRRPEARHVGILTSGSIVAQVVLLATTPWLSRLFGPDSFGLFSLMLSIVIGILTVPPRASTCRQHSVRLTRHFSCSSHVSAGVFCRQ